MRRGQKASAGQVVLKLRQIEVQTAQGKSLALACKEAEISEQSYYGWRKEYGGLQVDQAQKMKDLERENARLRLRLRWLVADLSLEKQVLAGVTAGKFIAPERRRQTVDGIREKYGPFGTSRLPIVGQHRGRQRYATTLPAVMGEREEVDGDAAGLSLGKRGTQGLEGVPIGWAREEPVAVDEVEQRHRLAPEGVDDVVVVDDLIVPSVRMSPPPR